MRGVRRTGLVRKEERWRKGRRRRSQGRRTLSNVLRDPKHRVGTTLDALEKGPRGGMRDVR